jgi:hypothetical protein
LKRKYLETSTIEDEGTLFLQNVRTDYAVLQHCIPEGSPQPHCCENLKTHIQENYLSFLLCPIKVYVVSPTF